MLTEKDLQELLQNPEPGAVNSDVDVTKRLWAKEAIERKRSELKETARQHAEFFREELAKLDSQEEFLENQIVAYLKAMGRSNVKSPLGTCGVTKRQHINWPDEQLLRTFVDERWGDDAVNVGVVVVKESVSKSWLRDYFKQYGELPFGAEVTEEDSFYWRRPKQAELFNEGQEVTDELGLVV